MESEYERTYERAWSILRQKVMNEPVLAPMCLAINKLMTESWAEAVEFERRQGELYKIRAEGADVVPESGDGQEEPTTPMPEYLKNVFPKENE